MSRQAYRSAFVPHDIKAPIRGAAAGPLANLTAAVKDMYAIAGERMSCGDPDWLANQEPAVQNCPPVQKILNAGASIIGKNVCDEFFYSVTGINAHYGMPVNLRAPGRIPGGSSAGSAAACGAGLCDFALGSDTGGSVRVPASFNGIYGLRPTHERIEHSGVADMAPSFDVPGWFAATPGVFRNVGAVLLDNRRVVAKIGRSWCWKTPSHRPTKRWKTNCALCWSSCPTTCPPSIAWQDRAGRFRSVARSIPHHPGLRDMADFRRLRHPTSSEAGPRHS